MEAYAAVLTYAIPGFVILIIIESLFAKAKGIQVNRPMDTISSLSSGMTNTLKSLMGLSVVILSYGWMESKMGVFDIKSTPLLYVLAFIGLDFAGYWSHRFNHSINIFWNRHIVHHSSEEFNLSCALRQTISAFVGVYFFLLIPLALLGVPPIVIAITSPIHLFAQFWYHTRLVNRLGFLEKIIVTPSHHRVHHAINPIYIDKNFSEIFIIWDKMFGTFQEELDEVPPVYGTKRPAGTWNPLLINFMHVWALAKDAWHTSSWWDKIRLWFMPTGWRPDDVKDTLPIQVVEDVYKRPKYETTASTTMQYWSWFQLIIHNILIFYMLVHIAKFDYPDILLYASFLMLSIFGYTTLMDNHKLALPAEVIKLVFGLGLIYKMGGWYMMDDYLGGATILIIIYFMASVLFTYYLLYIESSERRIIPENYPYTLLD